MLDNDNQGFKEPQNTEFNYCHKRCNPNIKNRILICLLLVAGTVGLLLSGCKDKMNTATQTDSSGVGVVAPSAAINTIDKLAPITVKNVPVVDKSLTVSDKSVDISAKNQKQTKTTTVVTTARKPVVKTKEKPVVLQKKISVVKKSMVTTAKKQTESAISTTATIADKPNAATVEKQKQTVIPTPVLTADKPAAAVVGKQEQAVKWGSPLRSLGTSSCGPTGCAPSACP